MISKYILAKAFACYSKIAANGFSIAIAESCTGGLLSFLFTTIPGSSKILDCAFITYSNSAKHEILGVSLEMLERYGAVSKEVSIAMALGALANSNADIGVAITGIAGPGGGSDNKPVGLIYISCLLSKVDIDCREYYFCYNNRNKIQVATVGAALDFISYRTENALCLKL